MKIERERERKSIDKNGNWKISDETTTRSRSSSILNYIYKYRLPKTKNQKKINRKILKFESRYSERKERERRENY